MKKGRRKKWTLFLILLLLVAAGFAIFINSNQGSRENNPGEEIGRTPTPPPGYRGYILTPARIFRDVNKGEEGMLAVVQNISPRTVDVEMSFLPIYGQSRSGEPLYLKPAAAENKKIIDLSPETFELNPGEVQVVKGTPLTEEKPALYGTLSASFKREGNPFYALSAFTTLRFGGKEKREAVALRVRPLEQNGSLRFYLSAKNAGNYLASPRVEFSVTKNGREIWKEEAGDQGILPGATREIESPPYNPSEGSGTVEARILSEGFGEAENDFSFSREEKTVSYRDGYIEVRRINGYGEVEVLIENIGNESFEPAVSLEATSAEGATTKASKTFGKLNPGDKRLEQLDIPDAKTSLDYAVIASLSDGSAVLDEKEDTLPSPLEIKERRFIPWNLVIGVVLALFLFASIFLLADRADKRKEKLG